MRAHRAASRVPAPRLLVACALAAALVAVLLVPARAGAECAPLRVILTGSVIKKIENRPVTRFPITLRMTFDEAGLPKLRWDAVVTDRDGRFRWSREFPADPCHDGNVLARYPKKLGGWLSHPLSRSYRKRARALPETIVLNLGRHIRRIERDELLDHLDGKTSAAEIDLFLEL
ncbi:MAG: hypothetical protein ACE5FC_10085 [Myxococcota bacterium]